MRGIHRGPVNSPHKWPVTRKMFPFDDVIMYYQLMKTAQFMGIWKPRVMMPTLSPLMGPPLRQPPVPSVTTKLASWRPEVFSVQMLRAQNIYAPSSICIHTLGVHTSVGDRLNKLLSWLTKTLTLGDWNERVDWKTIDVGMQALG